MADGNDYTRHGDTDGQSAFVYLCAKKGGDVCTVVTSCSCDWMECSSVTE